MGFNSPPTTIYGHAGLKRKGGKHMNTIKKEVLQKAIDNCKKHPLNQKFKVNDKDGDTWIVKNQEIYLNDKPFVDDPARPELFFYLSNLCSNLNMATRCTNKLMQCITLYQLLLDHIELNSKPSKREHHINKVTHKLKYILHKLLKWNNIEKHQLEKQEDYLNRIEIEIYCQCIKQQIHIVDASAAYIEFDYFYVQCTYQY